MSTRVDANLGDSREPARLSEGIVREIGVEERADLLRHRERGLEQAVRRGSVHAQVVRPHGEHRPQIDQREHQLECREESWLLQELAGFEQPTAGCIDASALVQGHHRREHGEA